MRSLRNINTSGRDKLERYASGFALKYSGRAEDITKAMVYGWMNEPKPGRLRKDNKRGPSKVWSQAAKRDAGSVVKRIFTWAHNQGRIKKKPTRWPTPRGTRATLDAH